MKAYPNKSTGSARPRSTWKWKSMFRGMDIPGDMVEEEGDIEGDSSDGYWTPPPDFVPASDLSLRPLLSLENLKRGGRPEKHSIKGM